MNDMINISVTVQVPTNHCQSTGDANPPCTFLVHESTGYECALFSTSLVLTPNSGHHTVDKTARCNIPTTIALLAQA